MSSAEPAGSVRIQSVERAAALLRAVAASAAPGSSATALAQVVGLNRTTTWRILTALEQERLVVRDHATGTYALGFGLLDLAGQAGGAGLVRSAEVVLRRLAVRSGETAALAVMQEGALTYAAEVTSGSVVAAGWQGREVALHATSTGKVLLAHLPAGDLRLRLGLTRGGRLPRFTPTTITSLAELEKELATTREQGYASCRGEFESSAWGVSAPVLDTGGRPVAVVSIWGPGERLTPDRFAHLGAMAIEAAAEIAGRTPSLSVSTPSSTEPEES